MGRIRASYIDLEQALPLKVVVVAKIESAHQQYEAGW
jgi:hypothetical protein